MDGIDLTPAMAVDLISDFYGASMDSRYWPTALGKLREALDAEVCGLAEHDFGRGYSRFDHAVGVDVGWMQSYGEEFGHDNVWMKEEGFRAPGVVWRGEDLAGEGEGRGSGFYQHWLAPQGLWHQMFGVLDRQGGRALYLYVARAEAGSGFSEEEAALLHRLLPYLQRALRAGQVLRRNQHVRQVALDALDVMPVGMMLVSAGGMVLAANRVAREVMAGREALRIGRQGLEVAREGRRFFIKDMIAEARGARASGSPARTVALSDHAQGPRAFSVPRAGGLRPLSVMVWSIGEATEDLGWDDPAAIVFLGDPDRPITVDEARLRQLYGLTRAEAKVAALLAQGHRLDEIAELLGVAYETTRKHLKKVLSKMEIDRQAELVRLLLSGPAAVTL